METFINNKQESHEEELNFDHLVSLESIGARLRTALVDKGLSFQEVLIMDPEEVKSTTSLADIWKDLALYRQIIEEHDDFDGSIILNSVDTLKTKIEGLSRKSVAGISDALTNTAEDMMLVSYEEAYEMDPNLPILLALYRIRS